MESEQHRKPPPRVFLSYCHQEDEAWTRVDSRLSFRETVLALANRLRGNGVDARLDQYELAPPEGWPRWCWRQIEVADFVLVICSQSYHDRFCEDGTAAESLGVRWEGAIISQALYDDAGRNRRFVPVALQPQDVQWVPRILRGSTLHVVDGEEGYRRLYRHLTGQPTVTAPPLGQPVSLGPRKRRRRFRSKDREWDDAQFTDPRRREVAEALDEAYRHKAELASRGEDTKEAVEAILELRRRLREGRRLEPGDLLADGRFLLQELLGQGGFARVFKAYDQATRRCVAIKVLHGQFARDRSRRERFSRGARAMGRLDHPGIVKMLEMPRSEEGFFYFAMEYLTGGTLRDAVLAGRFMIHEKLALLRRLAAALDHAHREGVVHRDVKPENVLLDSAGAPKLTDFDLVRTFDSTGGTRTGMLGTIVYTAPEAMVHAEQANASADVYSLAVTSLFVLLGRDLPLELLRDIERFLGRQSLPLATRRLLGQAMAWDPSDRPTSAGAFIAALEQSLRRLSLPVDDLPLRAGLPEMPRFHLPESSNPTNGPPIDEVSSLRILVLGDFLDEGPKSSEPEGFAFVDEKPQFRVDLASLGAVRAELGGLEKPSARVERLWRGVDWLLSAGDSRVEVVILPVSKQELGRDFEEVPETAQSGLHSQLHHQEYDRLGGRPFGLVVADLEFGPGRQDISLLRSLARVCASSHAVFLGSASPELLGVRSWSELEEVAAGDLDDIRGLDTLRGWQQFRMTGAAGWLALAAPDLKGRTPSDPGTELEMGGAMVVAATVAASHARHGWSLGLEGEAWQPPDELMGPEATMGHRKASALARLGLVGWTFEGPNGNLKGDCSRYWIPAAPTLAALPGPELEENERYLVAINGQLPVVLLRGRLAQFLKRCSLEDYRPDRSDSEVREAIMRWLEPLVEPLERSPEEIARRPFAAIEVTALRPWEDVGVVGRFRIALRPHFGVSALGAEWWIRFEIEL